MRPCGRILSQPLDSFQGAGSGAASEVKAYWAMMEQAYHRRADENRKEAEVYSAALFQEAEACLDRAQSAVAGDRPVLRERVALVRAGLEYTRLVTEIRLLVESKATDAATIAKLNEDWKGIEAIVNANRATINRQYFRREGLPMRRLNPDYLERK
jgi:hypothetical protein